jgi:hypothetical protein
MGWRCALSTAITARQSLLNTASSAILLLHSWQALKGKIRIWKKEK